MLPKDGAYVGNIPIKSCCCVLPCPFSQGGWEIDIVKNVVAVLNKYEDAVLLGEPYLPSGTLVHK